MLLQRPWPSRYGVAIGAVACALVAMLLLDGISDSTAKSPYLVFSVAVLASAVAGGAGPGLLATLGSAVTAIFFFAASETSFEFDRGQLAWLGVFIGQSALIAGIGAYLRRSVRVREQALAEGEEARAHAALIEAQLREAGNDKDEFLAIVSHELRNPITAIYGGARLLTSRGDRIDAEDTARVLEDIENEAERLYRLVENLLSLAKTELSPETELEPVLLQRVVERTVRAFQHRRPGRAVAVDADEALPPAAALSGYVEQILRNLLGNADKYSPAEASIDVRVSEAEDGRPTIEVLDRGPGIGDRDLDRIFERFYRSPATATAVAGMGLGLTVCKRLVEAQGGEISAHARAGGGSTMKVVLPLYQEV